jgi:hypothetical protein
VPTARATVVRPAPFGSREEADAWLSTLRGDDDAAQAELDAALRIVNRARAAQRAAAGDPYAGDVSTGQALACRVGYGSGESVADGRFTDAIELPRAGARRPRR